MIILDKLNAWPKLNTFMKCVSFIKILLYRMTHVDSSLPKPKYLCKRKAKYLSKD